MKKKEQPLGSVLEWVVSNNKTPSTTCAACVCKEANEELGRILVAMKESGAHAVSTASIDGRLREVDSRYKIAAKKCTLQRHLQEHAREAWDAAKGLS